MLKRGVYLLGICAICLFIISVPLFAEDQAESFYADAIAIQSKGKHAEAKAAYQQIIQQYPDSLAAGGARLKLLGYEAQSLAAAGNDAAVQAKITDAKKTYADHVGLPWFLYGIAKQYDDLKKYEKAGDLYGQIIKQYPDGPVVKKAALKLLGHKVQSLVAAGNDAAVKAEIANVEKDFVNHADLPQFLDSIADQYRKLNKYDQARDLYGQIVGQYPNSPVAKGARQGLVKIYFKSGQTGKAVRELDNFLNCYSGDDRLPDIVADYVRQIYDSAVYDKTIEFCQFALTKDLGAGKELSLVECLVKGYWKAGKVDVLGSLSDTLLKRHEDSADWYVGVALIFSEVYLQNGDYFGALEITKTAFGKYPFHARSVELLAVQACACLNLSDLSQAKAVIKTLQTDYRYSAGFGQAMNEIGKCYRRLGEYAEAIALHQFVLDVKSDPVTELRAYEGIGQVYARQGNDQMVLQIADTMASIYKDEEHLAISLFVLGEEFYIMAQEARKEGDPNSARINYEKAIAVWENNIRLSNDPQTHCLSYYGIGLSHRELADYVKAADALQEAYQANPKFKYADYCLFENVRCYGRLAESGKVSRCEAFYNSELFLEELKEKFPESKYISYAQQLLAQCTEQ